MFLKSGGSFSSAKPGSHSLTQELPILGKMLHGREGGSRVLPYPRAGLKTTLAFREGGSKRESWLWGLSTFSPATGSRGVRGNVSDSVTEL